jgi:two-component system response regulator
MEEKLILLVEDSPDDQALTLRALKKNNIRNRIVIRQDGAEALDFLFCQGADAGRDPHDTPQVILRRIRADERTRLLPVVILTSSREEQDMIRGYGYGANSYVRKPIDFNQFVEAVNQLGLYWLVLNEPPPV